MSKRAVSVTLDENNVVWLRAKTLAAGGRSLSETLDRIVDDARLSEAGQASPKSVVGSLRIADSDPDLTGADVALRTLFTPRMPAAEKKAARR